MLFGGMREVLGLGGVWGFRRDPGGSDSDAIVADHGRFAWRDAPVPGDFAHACPEDPDYEGICWYRKAFRVPRSMEGRRVVLRFGAVNHRSSVFLNGAFLGGSACGFLPFEHEVTGCLRAGGDNVLLVMADNSLKVGFLPTEVYWKNAGGVIRDVHLYATGPAYIKEAHVEAAMDGTAVFTASFGGPMWMGSRMRVAIYGMAGEGVYMGEAPISAEGAAGGPPTASLRTEVPGASRWSPETPSLYRAVMTLCGGDGAAYDSVGVEYGYRTVGVADGKVTLNGEAVFLKGFNRHEDSPVHGGAFSREAAEADFAGMKAAGANFVRMCHYPHDDYELEVADRLGLMLLAEIPFNAYCVGWWDPKDPMDPKGQKCAQVYASCKEALRRMVSRDRNHPSVIIWSVGNECKEDDDEIKRMNGALVGLAKSLDPSRLCAHVSMYTWLGAEHRLFDRDDVICVNMYGYQDGMVRSLASGEAFDPEAPVGHMKAVIAGLKERYPGKPVIMTEFGYSTERALEGLDAERNQADCIRAVYPALRECAEGAAVWIYADHAWPFRRSIAEVSEFGLLRRDRTPKEAFAVYSDLLKK
ncbi:MAG: hypothetical protein FWE70_04180 [Oscillospiraceae bacterium]|nr:hypothetical protein [Oscillospiraceae bacterium]